MSSNTDQNDAQSAQAPTAKGTKRSSERTVGEIIAIMKDIGPSEAAKKKSAVSRDDLVEVAKVLKLKHHEVTKEVLTANIFERWAKVAELDLIEGVNNGAAPVVAGGVPPPTFTKDVHTVPRILNLLIRYPNELVSMELQASRQQLQLKETGASRPMFIELAAQFNSGENTGGLCLLAKNSPLIVDEKKINPEFTPSVPITPKLVWSLVESTLRVYRKLIVNWFTSGTNNDLDFWSFCKGNTDVYYLHLLLKSTDNRELYTFCSQGVTLPEGQGVDTAVARISNNSNRSTSSSTNDSSGNIDFTSPITDFTIDDDEADCVPADNKKKQQQQPPVSAATKERKASNKLLANSIYSIGNNMNSFFQGQNKESGEQSVYCNLDTLETLINKAETQLIALKGQADASFALRGVDDPDMVEAIANKRDVLGKYRAEQKKLLAGLPSSSSK